MTKEQLFNLIKRHINTGADKNKIWTLIDIYNKRKEGLDSFHDLVLVACSEQFLVSVEDIKGDNRKRPIPDIRKIYSKILFDNGYTREKTGETINRNHSTITVNLTKFDNLYQTDFGFKNNYDEILLKIQEEINKNKLL